MEIGFKHSLCLFLNDRDFLFIYFIISDVSWFAKGEQLESLNFCLKKEMT